MREILFRGKRTDNGNWHEGEDIMCKTVRGEVCLAKIGEDWISVAPETVGQYTGLTDKNGAKIFEGDIVKGIAYSVERIGVIVWIDEIASFGVHYFKSQNPTTWEKSSILRCASMGKTDKFAAEIIGNIHDNPELLKGGGENG